MFEIKRFGYVLRQFREKAGYKRFQFAPLLNINAEYLGQIERGEKIPSIDLVVSIVNLLGISIKDCFVVKDKGFFIRQNLIHKINLMPENDIKYIYKLLLTLDSIYRKEWIKIFDSYALGRKIQEHRKRNELSQIKLAKKLKVSQNTIFRIEKGNISTLNILKLNSIANVLGVTLDDLLSDSIDILKEKSHYSLYIEKIEEILLSFDENQLFTFDKLLEDFLKHKNNMSSEDI